MRIALTLGEPAGIGPELTLLLHEMDLPCPCVVFGDPDFIQARAQQLKKNITLTFYDPNNPPTEFIKNHLHVYPVKLTNPVVPGKLDTGNSAFVLNCLTLATKACLRAEFNALVTNPVHKAVIQQAGFSFTGQTEWIANLAQRPAVMMLVNPHMRVALVTTHIPLKEVSQKITKKKLTAVLNIIHHDCQHYFGLAKPSIYVAGLNPHAGENGFLGNEELDIINPVITELQQQGINVIGSLPADTLFTEKYLNQADIFVAMYHDQGLSVIKYADFSHCANVTLGLPILRTSPAHGTALDLVGSNQINSTSIKYAYDTAFDYITNASGSLN